MPTTTTRYAVIYQPEPNGPWLRRHSMKDREKAHRAALDLRFRSKPARVVEINVTHDGASGVVKTTKLLGL